MENLFRREKGFIKSGNDYSALLDILDQLDLFEAELSRAYDQGGLVAANRVIVKPVEPNCNICGRAVIPAKS